MQRHVAASLGVAVSAQAVEQRFDEASVALMRRLFEELIGCGRNPSRSLLKAKQVVQAMTPCLALSLASKLASWLVVQQTAQAMSRGCTLATRGKASNSAQLLHKPTLVRKDSG